MPGSPRTRALALGWLALMCALADRVQALDGVIEINQARANGGGITPGDTPGLPITISTGAFAAEPMSFRLTGPLVDSTTSNVIEIVSPNVTLDLNGFAITCLLGQCTGKGVSSSSAGVSVINGTVRGFAEGVSLTGSGARVDNVRLLGNGTGAALGGDCTISDSVAIGNSAEGMIVGAGCIVKNNTVSNNGTDGICTLQGGNVLGNTARGNTGFGLNLNTATGYSQNVVSGNTGGTVTGGVPVGLNVCNGSLTCP